MRACPAITWPVAICLLLCGCTRSDSPPAVTDPVRDMLDARLKGVPCEYTDQMIWPFEEGRRRPTWATGCSSDVGDTTVYAYRDSAGRVLVAGRSIAYWSEHIGHEVRTDSARLGRTLDSLRVALDRRYGAHATCRLDDDVHGPPTYRAYRWDVGDSATVLLALADLETTAFITVEAHARSITCGSVARPPHAR